MASSLYSVSVSRAAGSLGGSFPKNGATARNKDSAHLSSSFCSVVHHNQLGSSLAASSSLRLACLAGLQQKNVSGRRNLSVGVAVAASTPYIPPTVGETKAAFLNAYKKPIPSIYNNAIQELIVQQHLIRYNLTYKYDPVFALGFVTVYDQLMDGLPPQAGDAEKIFKAYISALNENPDTYRKDAKALEEWATAQTAETVVSFAERSGKIETSLKDIATRAATADKFHYSRFFAIGLFRILELCQASQPSTLEALCKALGVSKVSIDRDLGVYRSLLTKLSAAKELLAEYLEREKKKQAERESAKTTS